MSLRKNFNNLTLEDVIKVDPFGEKIYIKVEKNGSFEYIPLIQNNKVFFENVYSNYKNKKLIVMNGASKTTEVMVNNYIEEITNLDNSRVVFFSGYAGCGKSIFIQKLIIDHLNSYDYDYNYYNYDIGAYYDYNIKDRIKKSIQINFLKQFYKVVRKKDLIVFTTILNNLNVIIKVPCLSILDPKYEVLSLFYNSELLQNHIENIETITEDQFLSSMLRSDMSTLTLEQILVVDYIFRIAVYLSSDNSNNTLIVCYDNMDSIENESEIGMFRKTLIALRRNLDDFITELYEQNCLQNINKLPPAFLICSTYRKIMNSKFFQSERADDYAQYNFLINYVDISNLYDFADIVVKRKEFFYSKLNKRSEYNIIKLLKYLATVEEIVKLKFFRNKYSSLWNKNKRTCAKILNGLLDNSFNEVKLCINFLSNDLAKNEYVETMVDSGANSVFLNVLLRYMALEGLFNESHLDLIKLNEVYNSRNIDKGLSLSRILLTYINNFTLYSSQNSVSLYDIFKEFNGIFGENKVCKCIENLVTRDEADTWRRPISYFDNAIMNDTVIANELERQLNLFKTNNEVARYTKFSICLSGEIYIRHIVSSFDFFSVRIAIDKRNDKNDENYENYEKFKDALKVNSIYCLKTIEDIKFIIDNVYNAVETCCKNMIEFGKKYISEKNIENMNDMFYTESYIHPRTIDGNSQLHTERIIFAHISHLDKCRLYHLYNMILDNDFQTVNSFFVEYIKKYVDLYDKYIIKISDKRKELICKLKEKITDNEKSKDIEKLKPIEMDTIFK